MKQNDNFLNDDIVKELFLEPKLIDKKVSVVCILANDRTNDDITEQYLGFMYSNVSNLSSDYKCFALIWTVKFQYSSLRHPRGYIQNFSSKSKKISDKSGILVWNDVFFCDSNTVVLLKGHSGIEPDTSSIDSKLFAISALISSVTVCLVKNGVDQSYLDKCKVQKRHYNIKFCFLNSVDMKWLL